MTMIPSLIRKSGQLLATCQSTILVATSGKCIAPSLVSCFHTSPVLDANYNKERGNRKWSLQNEKVFPPQKPGEERRPAFVCHMRNNIRANYRNMWYQACFIRGMSIDEALKQLSFNVKGFTSIMKEVLLEAQEMAVREQGIEFKSNLWVAESFVGKGQYFKGMRRHARMRIGEIRYQFNHYYVKLEEGKPPEHFYAPKPTGEDMLQKWMEKMRSRHIGITI